MRSVICAAIFCAVSLNFGSTSFSQKRSVPPISIEGFYENLTVGKQSGDLEGMRVILIDGGGSIYAIVQEAAGGAELPEPVLSRVEVKGSEITFSVRLPGNDEPQTFAGKVSVSGLRLGRRAAGEPQLFLRRKKC